MSDEYISREEMIDAVDHLHIIPSIDGTGKPTPTEDFRVQFIGTVLKIKVADVAPVRHGRWIKTEDGAECEKCGREAVYQIVDDHWEYEPFCPHCGAIMDNKRENKND